MTLGEIIGKGRTADIHAYGEGKVVKLFHDHIQESWIDYEYRINRVANQFKCPVPKVYEIVDIENRKGIVFERIDGETVTDLLKKPFSKASHIAMRTAAAHAEVSKVSFGSSGHPFDENSIKLPRQYDYFKEKINDTTALTDDEKKDVIDYLMRLPDGLRLCHGDLHPENFIVQGSTHYIIDWTNAYIGHPASDIARSLLMMESPFGKSDLPSLMKPMIGFIIQSYMKSFIRVYLSLIDIKHKDIKAWTLPVAAARLHENVPDEREWLLSIIKDELNKQRYM